MNKLPWSELVNAISINPDMATRKDIAKMAASISKLQEVYEKWNLLEKLVNDFSELTIIGEHKMRDEFMSDMWQAIKEQTEEEKND